ncbi:restriction endonuclease subunit S [Desulforudis sp. 1031]
MRFGDAPSRARRVLRRGDTIVSTVRTYLKAVYHVDRDVDALVCSTGFAVLTPGPGTQPRYVSYLAQSSPFTDCISAESVGTAYPAIAESRLGSFHVPVPTLWEQTAIVRFLDYMDRRIRRYIRAKQKLIKLLEEYKQALIHQAVTGRIDVRTGQSYPSYKDSGVEWLGQMPEHWELKPLKRWVRINASVLPDTTPADYEFRYIDIGTVGTGFLTREPQQLRFGNAPSRARRVLHMGDTIISTVRTYLKAVYYVDGDAEALVCSTGFAVLTPGPSTQPKYVSYLVQSNTFTDRVTAESVGTAYPAIAEGRLGSFYVPIPPLPEQTAIVEYLDAQTAKIGAAIAAARSEIELLREYRTRLIADVVTGKLDVREVAARLPEEPPEEEAELMDTDETAEGEATDDDAAAEALSEEEVEP